MEEVRLGKRRRSEEEAKMKCKQCKIYLFFGMANKPENRIPRLTSTMKEVAMRKKERKACHKMAKIRARFIIRIGIKKLGISTC